jgi:hypothetical protein
MKIRGLRGAFGPGENRSKAYSLEASPLSIGIGRNRHMMGRGKPFAIAFALARRLCRGPS